MSNSGSVSSYSGARERLILALDFPSVTTCRCFLDQLRSNLPTDAQLRWVKVGLELFVAAGPSLVAELRDEGYQVFLDLKFYDIPNTVAGAIRSVLPLEPALLTVHASGGPAMLHSAAQAAEGSKTRLLAVTVLTSMDAPQLTAIGIADQPAAQVTRLALAAQSSGIDGLVCSPQEAAALKALLPAAHLVTPGIRPAGTSANDQQRTSSPAQALRNGASQLVIGRPITAAQDPAAAYLTILSEIEGNIQHFV